jgi:hypothetical protein
MGSPSYPERRPKMGGFHSLPGVQPMYDDDDNTRRQAQWLWDLHRLTRPSR